LILHPLYHWSPADRREQIAAEGLRPDCRPVCHSERAPVLCLSPSPSQAWALSAAVFGEPGVDWDCWQVTLGGEDDVEVRAFTGNRIEEVRVSAVVPVARLWWIGRRTVSAQPGGW
jgi:hypothetical protein